MFKKKRTLVDDVILDHGRFKATLDDDTLHELEKRDFRIHSLTYGSEKKVDPPENNEPTEYPPNTDDNVVFGPVPPIVLDDPYVRHEMTSGFDTSTIFSNPLAIGAVLVVLWVLFFKPKGKAN